MPENLFDIMARLPMLEEAMRNYQSPEEQDEEALNYVRFKWRDADEKDIYSPSTDVLRVKRDEATCAKCGGGKCSLSYWPLFLSAERYRGKTAYVVRWLYHEHLYRQSSGYGLSDHFWTAVYQWPPFARLCSLFGNSYMIFTRRMKTKILTHSSVGVLTVS